MPPFFAHLRIQQKFVAVTTLFTVAALLLLGTATAVVSSRFLYQSVEKQGRLVADTVANLIVNELIYEQLGLVEEGGLIDNYVTELYQGRKLDYLFVAVLDSGGRVISHNDFSQYGKVYDRPVLREAVRGEIAVRRESGPPARLEFAAPLAIGNKRWGTLYFAVSLARATAASRRTTAVVVGGGLVALACGLVLIALLSRTFIRPITDLAAAMEAGESELPSRKVTVRGHDELASLGRAFNRLIDRIHQVTGEMREAHERLLEAEKLATLGVLASSVAHRINNPLGGMRNCIAMLRRRGDDPAFRQQYLNLLAEGVAAIEETVGQLLWSAGRGRDQEPRCRPAVVLATVVRFLDYRLQRAGIILEQRLEPGIELALRPHDCNQILMNLLVNAIQAIGRGGRILVACGKTGDGRGRLVVTDNGPGMDETVRGRLFDRFYTTKRPGEGTGLGLWMTYELVRKYHGAIRLRTAPGIGTSFIITLPLAPAREETETLAKGDSS